MPTSYPGFPRCPEINCEVEMSLLPMNKQTLLASLQTGLAVKLEGDTIFGRSGLEFATYVMQSSHML